MKKDNPLMPMMMEMMSGMLPIQAPEMNFGSDPITKFFQNLAMRQIAKNEALKAEISTSKRTQAGNNMATMREAITFSETVFEEIQQKKDAQETRKIQNEILKEQRDKLRLENYQRQLEIKDTEINIKLKEKEMGE